VAWDSGRDGPCLPAASDPGDGRSRPLTLSMRTCSAGRAREAATRFGPSGPALRHVSEVTFPGQ
jgi:hypothetical protein